MPAALPLDGKRLAKVAVWFRVCEDKQPAFQRCLASALKEAWRGHGINNGLPRRSPVIKVLERIRKATPERALALLQRDDIKHEMAAVFLSCAIVPNEIEAWIVTASPEERFAAIDRARASAERLRDGGRTPGTPGNPAFDLFISQLYYFAAVFEGQPGNASRKGSDAVKGNIPKALEMLRPALPEDFIPAAEGSILNAVRQAKINWEMAERGGFGIPAPLQTV